MITRETLQPAKVVGRCIVRRPSSPRWTGTVRRTLLIAAKAWAAPAELLKAESIEMTARTAERREPCGP